MTSRTRISAAAASSASAMVSYPYLPHSSLGQSSHVSIVVRSYHHHNDDPHRHATTVVHRLDGEDGGFDDEKKTDAAEGGGGRVRHRYRQRRPAGEVEYRVEATLHGAGLPLHSVPASTRCAPSISTARRRRSRNDHRRPAVSECSRACYFDDRTPGIGGAIGGEGDGSGEVDGGGGGDVDRLGLGGGGTVLSLPVRWRDLTRDATLALDVVGTGGRQVGGTSLPLFDQFGKLRTGLQRLRVHMGVAADGGMRYVDTDDEGARYGGSFLNGGATPGLPPDGNGDEKNGDDDPKWRASVVLDLLDRPGRLGGQASEGLPSPVGSVPGLSSGRSGGPVLGGTVTPVPWLDKLTRARCCEILDGEEDDGGGLYVENDDGNPLPYDIALPQEGTDPLPCYIIIEIPSLAVPVVHEEMLYPTPLHGASGTVTAHDLAIYHKRLASEEEEEQKKQQKEDVPGEREGTRVPSVLMRNRKAAQDEHDLCVSLVQLLDHESEEDNPVEDKYRALEHDVLRGLVDPALKPDRAQRARLASIIASPSHHLTREEQDLLWRFRFSLVDNRRALTKFLLAVDWTVESEVIQAAELLDQWRKRSPIEVTDALKLLGKNVAFQTSLVRSYAIETLGEAPDNELRLYLLQLVQAIKYEDSISGTGAAKYPSEDPFPNASEPARSKSARVSSLANFLIERASRNLELATCLYWYLKVELQDPNYAARYRDVFVALEEKLSMSSTEGGSKSTKLDSSSLKQPATDPKSGGARSSNMWDVLLAQDTFITGIMECQMNARDARGKKDAKEAHLREALESGGFRYIQHSKCKAVPLPSAPYVTVKGINPDSVLMFKSALYPAVVEFDVERISSQLPSATSQLGHQDANTYKVIVKTGDDLRQDQLVIMMIQLMDGLLKRGALDLRLKPYSIIAMSETSGLVEFVEGSLPISQVLFNHSNSIMQFFKSVAPHEKAKYSVQPEVMKNYIRSCAGYCVITYLLGVGDRHLDNIMLLPSGHFFHIDFGFIFGRDPKPLPPAFRLTREMVDGMGGIDSSEYQQFCSLACQAFNVLRKSAGLVLNLLHLMSDAGIEDLSNNPSSDADGVISKVEERFRLELTDEQAEAYFLGLINDSLAAFAPRVMEVFHQLSVARR